MNVPTATAPGADAPATDAPTRSRPPLGPARTAELVDALHADGIVGLPGALDTALVDRLDADVRAAFDEAHRRQGGTVSRGTNRFYCEVHPAQLSGFAALAGHPWLTGLAEAVLGPDWRLVEVGFDIPFAGARDQPWHRDFPMPEATRRDRRMASLAVNITTVDTTADMGPFEIAPGTWLDDDTDFDHAMFPPESAYPRYQRRATRKYPQRGDISIRSALTVHRGTANHSRLARPVVVLGLDAPGAGNDEHHSPAVTRAHLDGLPDTVREHLACPVVDVLIPIVQLHTIEGLVMGE